MEVSAYKVTGTIDYEKLVEKFGVSKIDKKILAQFEKYAPLHHLLRRNIFFAHRDLQFIFDQLSKGNTFTLYTGRAPSGPVHLGHLIPWYFTKWLQDIFDVELIFQFADEEKFLYKKDMTFEQTQEFLEENLKDVAAVGFNPKKTKFIIDTKNANDLYPIAVKVAKHITLSTAKATFGFENDSNIGSVFYTAMQAAPAALPSVWADKPTPVLIPHAIDQDPHFRLTRDVLPKLGVPKPASIQCKFLPSLTGSDGKMASSQSDHAILATDDAATIKKKINKYAFSGGQATVEEHRKLGGNPILDVSFQWLTFLEEDDEKIAQYESDYRAGKILSGEMKALAIAKITEFLESHQTRRRKVDVSEYL